MPTTIATATVIALAIVPGAFGAYTWALLNGQDWREKDWEAAVRFLAFSVLGLGAYVILGLWLPLPPALHILPSTYSEGTLVAGSLPGVFLPYLGHIVGAAVVGASAAGLHRGVCAIRGATPQPSAWDHFIKSAAPKRWVVIALKSGDTYAGYVHTAEESAPEAERDILLGNPAKWESDTKNYRVTSFRYMFLPAALVQSIGVVRTDDELSSAPAVGAFLFPEQPANGQSAPTTAEAIPGKA